MTVLSIPLPLVPVQPLLPHHPRLVTAQGDALGRGHDQADAPLDVVPHPLPPPPKTAMTLLSHAIRPPIALRDEVSHCWAPFGLGTGIGIGIGSAFG